MELISRKELKEKLDRKDDFKLVMTLYELAFQGKHIPGSLNLHTPEAILQELDQGEEIVVYCSNEACWASIVAYHLLVNQGFKRMKRYAGGLLDWEEAGYSLEGTLAEQN